MLGGHHPHHGHQPHYRSTEGGFGSYRDNDLKDMEMLNMAYQPGNNFSRNLHQCALDNKGVKQVKPGALQYSEFKVFM